MKELFGHLGNRSKYPSLVSTYNIGLLQTKAFKVIMGTTSKLLAEVNISNTEWVALGTIKDHSNGLRSLDLANIMDVEQPFITVTCRKLKKMGYINITPDSVDHRAKKIEVTIKGKDFVNQTEKILAKKMSQISAGISAKEADVYFKVLFSIVSHFEKK